MMIKKVLLTSIFTLLIFILGISLKVQILNAATPTEDWQENYSCDSTKKLLSFSDAGSLIKSPFDDSQNMNTEPELTKYCINLKYVSTLVDQKLTDLLLNTYDNIGFCPVIPKTGIRLVSAIDIDKKNKYGYLKDNYGVAVCCPSTAPYGKSPTWRDPICCPNDIQPVSNGWGSYTCQDAKLTPAIDGTKLIDALGNTFYSLLGNGIEATNPVEYNDPFAEHVFPDAIKIYTCPGDACFVKVGTNQVPNASRVNLTDGEKSKYNCIPSLTVAELSNIPDPNVPFNKGKNGTDYCFNGQIIPEATFLSWGRDIGLYLNCMKYPDKATQDQCIACYNDCKGQTSCPEQWNGLGCVSTDLNGLITRIFQIGVGIIGGVGMLRIMQAAIMRQSGDPAKIQESYDIITSVIVGFVVLLGVIVFLRLIGQQILPFDFFK